MPTIIDVRDLPSRLQEVLAQVLAGDDVILAEGSTPRARLVPITVVPTRTPGLHSGAMQTSADFDAPLPEEFWTGHK